MNREPCPRLLVAVPVPEGVAGRARADFAALLSQDVELSADQISTLLVANPSVAAVLVSSRVRVDAGLLRGMAGQVRIVSSCSAGVDHIDLVAASQLGVQVTNTPDVVTEATADMAMLLMLGAARRMREYGRVMDSGWNVRFALGEMLGVDLNGRTLGIFGMGRIGQALAQRARAFGMRIAYFNRRRLRPDQERGAQYCATLEELLSISQVLSLHAPGGAALTGVIDQSALALLPKGAILVNTARGGLVNESDLLAALDSGHIAAAGLDVFCAEPAYDLRFRGRVQVFMAPHMGTATRETRHAMGFRALENVAAALAGATPRDIVS